MIEHNDYGIRNDLSGHYFGNYRLIRLLGHGSFASVYLGEHQYLKRMVAIKILHTILAEQEKTHFLTEAQLLANLSHPRIIRVLEFTIAPRRTYIQNSVVIENIPFLVMDYVPGGNLRTIYPMGTRLFLDTMINYIYQIADALQYAHNQRIIHRDIKPENLLLNEREEIMLSDFGLALFAPASRLLSGQGTAGTAPYTAPEQLRGKPRFASDQYSLGIIAYEWLSGYPPFRGGEAEIIMQHISSPPPPLRTNNRFIPQRMENVILKTLEKDPSQRYETVLDFAQALQESYQSHPYTVSQTLHTMDAPTPLKGDFPLFFYYLSQEPILLKDNIQPPTTHRMEWLQENRSYKTPPALRNRQRMLRKVRAIWINGVLEASLYEGTFITPTLHNKQDAVASQWPAKHYPIEELAQKLTPDISITEAFEQSGGELLILGEAGSGKTTLLLQLTRDLIERAEQDESFPLPIVFPLSSWAERQLPFDQWLIEELNTKYQIPRLLAEQWLRAETILPLLDGLDEVVEHARSACVTAINAYKQLHGLSQMVVCSRLTEYLLFPPRVFLQRAIIIQPLTPQQVDTYFQNTGKNFAVITEALRSDPFLYDLIKTPLMLHIITLAYQDRSPIDLVLMRSPRERYQYILSTYVEQMLQRHPIPTDETPQQLTNRLAYLATKMLQNNQVIFYMEQLQPGWINKNSWLSIYIWLAVLLPGTLIGGLVSILANVLLFHTGSIGSFTMDAFYGMVIGYLFSNRPSTPLSMEKQPRSQHTSAPSSPKGRSFQTALFVGLITFLCMGSTQGWTVGLVNGTFLALLSIPIDHTIRNITRHTRSSGKRNSSPNTYSLRTLFPLEHIKNGIPIGIACGLTSIITLLVNHSPMAKSFTFLVFLGIRDSLHNTLLGILLSLFLTKNDSMIHCAEVVSWSWKRFGKSLTSRFYNLLIGLLVGVISNAKQLFQGNLHHIISSGLTGLMVMLGISLVSAILEGVSSNKLNDHYRSVPNEGIKRSLFHGTVSFCISATIFVFFTVITSILSLIFTSGPLALIQKSDMQNTLHTAFINTLLLAPVGGLLVALLLGWLAVWQHNVLRIILSITENIPLNLIHFLNSATESVLLRRAGGGYIFIHRTLLKYFAFLNDPLSSSKQQIADPEPTRLVRLLDV